jgi:fructose-specific phosphotransferase system IIA component
VIHDRLHSLQTFFVPIFFTVVGMLVNPAALWSKEVMTFGLIYTAGAVIAKVVGCGIPALALSFNKLGALRIGLGMVPRGEVALIIAGIGLSKGILGESIFGAAIMMTLLTTIIAPPLLNFVLKINKCGTKKDVNSDDTVTTEYSFPSKGISDLLEKNIIENFRSEGFFISVATFESIIYSIRKEEVSISLIVDNGILRFKSNEEDVALIKNIVFETLLALNHTLDKLRDVETPDEMRKVIPGKGRTRSRNLIKKIDTDSIILGLQGKNKEEIIKSLIDQLVKANKIKDANKAFDAVMERENVMPTGLKEGIAIPHARISSIKNGIIALGILKNGVDFGSIDGVPSKIVALVLSPSDNATSHIQMIAGLASIFSNSENRDAVLNAKSQDEIFNYLAHIA